MDKHIILSVISDDKPGVVKCIAKIVKENNGNWLESQLSQLAGKFAGVVRVCVNQEHLGHLRAALAGLSDQGIKVYFEELDNIAPQVESRMASFTAIGPDRPGIVMEISQALSQYGINMVNLCTQCSSMPYSGDPLFEAEGELSIPADTQMDALYDQLCNIADQLAIDIHLEESAHEQLNDGEL